MNINFEELRRSIPSIHAFKPNEGVSNLVAQDGDADRSLFYFQDDCVMGGGVKDNPYRPKIGCAESPHRVIIGMWFELRSRPEWPRDTFVFVNDWLLRMTPEGVEAADGHVTRFI